MKRSIAILLILALLLPMAALAEETALSGKAASRTGPGTQYSEELGVLEMPLKLTVVGRVEGETNWVHVEFTQRQKLYRIYILQSKVLDAGNAPLENTEYLEDAAAVSLKAYYGPGEQYASRPGRLDAGTSLRVFGLDGDWALCDYREDWRWARGYIPVSGLASGGLNVPPLFASPVPATEEPWAVLPGGADDPWAVLPDPAEDTWPELPGITEEPWEVLPDPAEETWPELPGITEEPWEVLPDPIEESWPELSASAAPIVPVPAGGLPLNTDALPMTVASAFLSLTAPTDIYTGPGEQYPVQTDRDQAASLGILFTGVRAYGTDRGLVLIRYFSGEQGEYRYGWADPAALAGYDQVGLPALAWPGTPALLTRPALLADDPDLLSEDGLELAENTPVTALACLNGDPAYVYCEISRYENGQFAFLRGFLPADALVTR